eukprot:s3644_g4.t1
MRPVDRKRRPFAFRVSKGAPGQKTHSSRQLAGLSRPSRCFEAQLWRLLQRAPPATRKQLLQRFSEGQRLALERWVLTRKPTLLDPGGCSKARLCGQPRPRRGPAPVVAVAGAGAPYVCSHRSHGGPVRYDARVSCWPFLLFTKMTLHLPTALNQLEVLGAVQRRWQRDMCQKQDFASCEVRELSFKRFNDAVALEFEAREMDLTLDSAFRFQAFVPANFLLGRRLGTPHFVVSEAGLRKGYEAWQSLYCSIHSAYALDHDNFCGRRNRFTSIANTYSAERLQEVWQKLRATYSAVFEKAGQSGKRVETQLALLQRCFSMRSQMQPCGRTQIDAAERMQQKLTKLLQRWRLNAERRSRPREGHKGKGV